MRGRGEEFNPIRNLENRIQAGESQEYADPFGDVHEFEANSFCLGPLTQLQHRPQAAGIDRSD